jgi:orotate phosphoribosyltransferase-like protein
MADEKLLDLYGKALALGMIGLSDNQIQKELKLSDSEMNELLDFARDE